MSLSLPWKVKRAFRAACPGLGPTNDQTLDRVLLALDTAKVERSSLLQKSATLNFPSIAANAQSELTISVPGALVGQCVALGVPAAIEAGLVLMAYVSAADTVKVRCGNTTAGAIDPASGTFNVTVIGTI